MVNGRGHSDNRTQDSLFDIKMKLSFPSGIWKNKRNCQRRLSVCVKYLNFDV